MSPVPPADKTKFEFELDAVISLSLIVMSAMLTPPVPLPCIVTAPFVTVLVNVVPSICSWSASNTPVTLT